MKRLSSLAILGSTLFICTRSALAAPMVPTVNEPASYADFQFGLGEMRDNIESVSCGGWQDNPQSGNVSGVSAFGSVPLPVVSNDIPGRGNNLQDLGVASGQGERPAYSFPESAFGYLSACNVYDQSIHDEDLKKMGLNIVFDPVTDPGADPNVRLEPGDGTISINPGYWCLRYDKATPRWCEKLFDTFRRMAEIAPRPWSNEFCKCPFQPQTPTGFCQYVPTGPTKRYCFDYAEAAPRQDGTELDGTPKAIESADYTKTCTGQECRTPVQPLFGNELIKCEEWTPQFDGDDYIGHIPLKVFGGYDFGTESSFYRHYGGSFNSWAETRNAGQSPLTVKTPTFTWNVRADCYEYYQGHLDYPDGTNHWKEIDPKDSVTSWYDEQCELTILTNNQQNPELPEWKDTGPNGEKQKGTVKAPIFDVTEPGREQRNAPDPWVPDRETNLSLIDIKKLKELQGNFDDPSDISGVLGTILTTRQRASKTTPKNARSDQFDDSDHRALASFWEAQQVELLKMTADPETRLIMPARFLVGIAEDDPLFQYVKHAVSRSDGTVEITLRAGAEDLQNVTKSLMRTFIAPIEEVRIPIIVPLASSNEIDALIFQWQQWKKAENATATLENRPSKAATGDAMIAKLIQYRERLASVRRSRGAYAAVLTRMYDAQEEVRTYFADWFKEQTDQFLLTLERAEDRRELKRIWRLLQRSMLQTDECQMTYCSNQRFSPPVYSLLDNWWGAPEILPGEQRDHQYSPPYDLRTLNFTEPANQVFDFSNMKFSDEPLRVPVLWPVSVRVVLPSPPLLGEEAPDASVYPNLPPVPDETIFDSFTAPEVELPEKPTITLLPTGDLSAAKNMLRQVRKIIDGTPIEVQMWEEQALKDGASLDDGGFPPDGLQPNRLSMRSAYCRFQPSITIPPDEEQIHGYAAKIIHTEYDLKERLERLFSRWLPVRTEDMANRVARINQDFPNAARPPRCNEGVVCYFLPGEITRTTSWQWFMPTSAGTNFSGLANQLKNMTMPTEGNNPYYGAPIEVLDRIFSGLVTPLPFDLTPLQP